MLPFAIGIIAGAAAMRLLQKSQPVKQFGKAGQTLRKTGVAGLSALEHSSARLRSKLEQKDQPSSDEVRPTLEPGNEK
jgi:hypothetical protein